MKRSIIALAGVFLAICISICVMIWYSVHSLRQVRQEYDLLSGESSSTAEMIKSLEVRNASLRRITALDVNNAHGQPDAIAYLSFLRTLMDAHGITLMNMSSSGGNEDGPDNVLQVKIDGNYYQIVRMLAEIRSALSVARISGFSIKRNHNLPGELVEVDMRLEVFLEDD